MSQPHAAARILIVDDEPAQVNALCDTLRDEGHDPTGFTRPSDALAALRSTRVDLLLTDLRMPDMDGIELVRAALRLDPTIAAIVMTGHGTIDNAIEAMKSGATDYILKPFKLGQIRPVLLRALSVRRIRKLNAELEKTVRERTAALEVANKELEAFLNSVSHDLLAPARAIGGYFQRLLVGPRLGEPEHQYVQHIAANAKRLQELIAGLQRVALVSHLSLIKIEVNIRALVSEVIEAVRHQYPGREVDVRVENLPGCTADPTLLREVFANLLSNAFKFTAKTDSPRIEVGSAEGRGETVYFVRDNGPGFDMRHAEKVFGVFEQLHDGEEYGGTGVGLSIAERIVERHGGRIWAESQPGRGATFYLMLPNAV